MSSFTSLNEVRPKVLYLIIINEERSIEWKNNRNERCIKIFFI